MLNINTCNILITSLSVNKTNVHGHTHVCTHTGERKLCKSFPSFKPKVICHTLGFSMKYLYFNLDFDLKRSYYIL